MTAPHLSTQRPQTGSGPTERGAGRPLPLWFTLLLAAVMLAATAYGLLADDAYRVSPGVRETLPETLQGQDLVTLLAAGALVWGGVRARVGSLRGHIVWLAVCLYTVYTYLMYVVVPYNDAFLLYVAAIGLAGFGTINGLMRLDADAIEGAFDASPKRAAAWFLIVVGSFFATLWLSQILAVFPGGVPEGLFVYDIPSTVHVLDLTLILPLLVGTGILLLRGHPIAPVLAALLLVKMLTLGLALVSMNLFVAASGGGIDTAETGLWAAIAVIAAGWIVVGARRMAPVRRPWLRRGVW